MGIIATPIKKTIVDTISQKSILLGEPIMIEPAVKQDTVKRENIRMGKVAMPKFKKQGG